MNSPALLDVNVLIALIDPNHEFHEAAHSWFRENRRAGWATSPITQNACLRILGKPGYPSFGFSVTQVGQLLTEFVQAKDHHFWQDSISALDDAKFDLAHATPGKLTDIYLLGLAVSRNGRFVTFDRGVQTAGVRGVVPDHIETLTA